MCTLTLVPTRTGLRLAFNRDEERTRPPAEPPLVRRFGSRRVVMPVDSPSGGTWLAVNDAGLIGALLNGNPAARTQNFPRRSRGEIIPALIDCDTPAAALEAAEQKLSYTDFAPFRLVLVGAGLAADIRWDGHHAMVMTRLLGGRPILFTSSGLGDHVVDGPRRDLFEAVFSGPPATWGCAQDDFHRHAWPGRERISVNMSRVDARTVSFTKIELGETVAKFFYHADAPDRFSEDVMLELPLVSAGAQ